MTGQTRANGLFDGGDAVYCWCEAAGRSGCAVVWLLDADDSELKARAGKTLKGMAGFIGKLYSLSFSP